MLRKVITIRLEAPDSPGNPEALIMDGLEDAETMIVKGRHFLGQINGEKAQELGVTVSMEVTWRKD